MSRTYIEFDMPETCARCPLRWYDEHLLACYCRAFKCEVDNKYRLNISDMIVSRPDWCPLKEK